MALDKVASDIVDSAKIESANVSKMQRMKESKDHA